MKRVILARLGAQPLEAGSPYIYIGLHPELEARQAPKSPSVFRFVIQRRPDRRNIENTPAFSPAADEQVAEKLANPTFARPLRQGDRESHLVGPAMDLGRNEWTHHLAEDVL